MNRRQFHRTLTAALSAAAFGQAQQSGVQHSDAPNTKERTNMQLINKLIRFKMAVGDMPKAKAFYSDTLGLKAVSDYRLDDRNWWVSFDLPGDGASMVLSTAHENMKPGTMSIYFSSPDLAAAHQEISAKGAKVSAIKSDLYGPGSGVKWFNLQDPDGNQVFLAEA